MVWAISVLLVQFIAHTNGDSQWVCIVISGIGGSYTVHFLIKYSQETNEMEMEISVFVKNPIAVSCNHNSIHQEHFNTLVIWNQSTKDARLCL